MVMQLAGKFVVGGADNDILWREREKVRWVVVANFEDTRKNGRGREQ